MCGRVGLGREGKYYIDGRFRPVLDRLEITQNWNLPPSAKLPLLRMNGDGPDAVMADWGLKPIWWKQGKYAPSNARADTVQTSGYFKAAFNKRRGAIPIDGFYEWARNGDRPKQPYWIFRADGDPLWIAGLWEGGEAPTCTMVTTEPNDFMAEIHDRMPVILEPHEIERWIDATPAEAATMMTAAADGILERYPVSTLVNNVRNNSAACLARIE